MVRRLVRSFYSGPCPPVVPTPGEGGRPGRRRGHIDTTGLGIVLMDYLVAREWVCEDEIMRDVKVSYRLVRSALEYLKREQLVVGEQRRERAEGGPGPASPSAAAREGAGEGAAAARGPGGAGGRGGVRASAPASVVVYYSVDYPRLFDALQLRLHVMRQRLDERLRAAVAEPQAYVCGAAWCAKEFAEETARWLVAGDGQLRCDACGGAVGPAARRVGGRAEDERRAAAKGALARMKDQLGGLLEMVAAVGRMPHGPPSHGSLREWERARRKRIERGAQDTGSAGAWTLKDADGTEDVEVCFSASTNASADTQTCSRPAAAAPAPAPAPAKEDGDASGSDIEWEDVT